MPIYGDEKVRTIIRGILPSTRSKGARENARLIHRSHRTQMSQDLRRYRNSRYSDAFEDFEDDATDYEFFPDTELRYNMWDRREGDKLAALMRWGPKLVEDVRLLDRESKLRSILPDSMIGRHALSHLVFLDTITPEYEHESYFVYRPLPPVAPDEAYAVARDKLLKICGEHKGHKRFNDHLKTFVPLDYLYVEGAPVLLFGGLGDIDSFLRRCFSGRKAHVVNALFRRGENHPAMSAVAAKYLDLDYRHVNALYRWVEDAES